MRYTCSRDKKWGTDWGTAFVRAPGFVDGGLLFPIRDSKSVGPRPTKPRANQIFTSFIGLGSSRPGLHQFFTWSQQCFFQTGSFRSSLAVRDSCVFLSELQQPSSLLDSSHNSVFWLSTSEKEQQSTKPFCCAHSVLWLLPKPI